MGNEILYGTKLWLSESEVLTGTLSLLELENMPTKDAILISFAELEGSVLTEITPSTFSSAQSIVQEPVGLL